MRCGEYALTASLSLQAGLSTSFSTPILPPSMAHSETLARWHLEKEVLLASTPARLLPVSARPRSKPPSLVPLPDEEPMQQPPLARRSEGTSAFSRSADRLKVCLVLLSK